MSTPLSDSEQPLRRNRLKGLLPVLPGLLLVLASSAVASWVFGGLDLRDIPGPGGVKIVTALGTGNLDRDWATWTIASSLPIFDHDVLAACRFWMRLGGLLTVLGALLCGTALAGLRAGLCAGLIAACWSQPLYIQQLIGADSIALGLCWFGVGLAWCGGAMARREGSWKGPIPFQWWWSGIPLTAIGVSVAAYAIAVKVVALPASVLVALTPFLIMDRIRDPDRVWKQIFIRFFAIAATVALTWALCRSSFLPGQSGHVQDTPPMGLPTLTAGWERLTLLPKTQPETAVLLSLVQLSWIGALIPGRSWLWRAALGCAGTAALAYSAEAIGDKIHVRQVTTAALPVVVLCGAGLGIAIEWIQRCAGWIGQRSFPGGHRALQPDAPLRHLARGLPWAIPATVSLFLFLDSLAFIHAWGALRAEHAGSDPVDLPRAPISWESRYARLGGITFEDTTAYGSIRLGEMAAEAPKSGVAGVPLRDARDFHLRAAAVLSGSPFVILEPQRCCSDKKASSSCAESVVSDLDRIGARLILPRTDTGPANRYGQREWTQQLETALLTRGGVRSIDNMWWLWEGSGTEGPLPCCGGGESCYAPGQPRAPAAPPPTQKTRPR